MNPVTPHSSGEFSSSNTLANRAEMTSLSSIVLASLAVTVCLPFRFRVNSRYLSVVTETFIHALPRNRCLSTQGIAYSVVFIAAEMCSNTPLPSNGFTCHNTPQAAHFATVRENRVIMFR
jgi:hypothetical protein